MSTLMNWSKKDLVNHCMALEHNNNVLHVTIDTQTKIGLDKVSKLDIHPTEAVIYTYDQMHNALADVNFTYQMLKNVFPNNKIVCIPNTSNLQGCSKAVLENYISMMGEIIKEL